MKAFFSLEEMYLLAASFGGNSIFGLPAKSVLFMRDSQRMEEGYQELKQKGVLDEAGEVTQAGFHVIRALEEYTQSEKYVKVQEAIFAFPTDTKELIFIIKVGEKESYQLHRIDKVWVPLLLVQKIALVNRPAGEEEKNFLLRQERMESILAFQHRTPPEALLEVVILDASQKLTQWLIFEENTQLLALDAQANVLYRASQYWLMKLLFEALEIPYRKEEVAQLVP
ncbi:DUF5081 family protein [Listeria fleischmannii]|uniref:DUF5081 domain-containing protein n=1 Tax=Listeria fleischmannii FSL S10-1203 TaxID=1265822 RepID=W7D8N9_9LIST|nr:DUF5081 family protein [Listeria fleischmannii]EUJ43861.1 hypothetical protein MCOL2_20358 [Listeria fleischmannii FSL S10-1203]